MAATAPRRDHIADSLRRDILRGTYAAGERLPAERDLASRLGANRSSVREALRTLEQMGLVSIRRGGGATVCGIAEANLEVVPHLLFLDGELNSDLLEQVLDVHEMLLVGATRLAVERASEDDIARARELLARLAAPGVSGDEFIDTAAALLDLIVAAGGNLVLQLARKAVNPLFEERFRDARKRLRPSSDELRPVVDRVVEALLARDASAAQDAVRDLLRLNRQRALVALEALHAAHRPTTPQ